MSDRARLQQRPQAASDVTGCTHGGNRSWTRRARRGVNAMPSIRSAIIYGPSLNKHPQDFTGWARFSMYHDLES
jgi:hypothetical protein